MDSTELDRMITDCAKAIAYLEDPIFWPKRLSRLLEVFEYHANKRTRGALRPADLSSLPDLALERLCHALIARLLYKRW
jgi:hypothetical protein